MNTKDNSFGGSFEMESIQTLLYGVVCAIPHISYTISSHSPIITPLQVLPQLEKSHQTKICYVGTSPSLVLYLFNVGEGFD